MAETFETTVLAPDLLVGDRLLATGIGGHEGEVRAIRVYDRYVSVDLGENQGAALGPDEVCQVIRVRREERPRLAEVHWLFAPLVDAASKMGR